MAYHIAANAASVHETLRRAILRTQARPGARITERDVAAELGVSRTPVREALARLHREGLVTPLAGRRRNMLEVSPLTLRELRQTSAATAAMEGIGATAAASLPKADRADLANQLGSLLESAANEIGSPKGSFSRALDLDARFHRTLTDSFLEPALVGWLEAARTLVHRYAWMFSPKAGVSAAHFRSEHTPMVTALRKGDGAGLRAALDANWSAFVTRIEPLLSEA